MGNTAKRIKNLPIGVKASVAYALSSVLSRGLAIITTPIFTRLMSPEQIGVVSLYNSWQGMLSGLVSLSLTSGGIMLALKEYNTHRDEYLSSVLSLTSIISVAFTAIVIVFSQPISGLTKLPSSLCILMSFGFIVMPAVDLWLCKQRYEYKYKAAAAYSIATSLVSTFTSLVVVIYSSAQGSEHLGVIRLLSGNAVTFFSATVLWIILMKKGKTLYNHEYWRYSLYLSLPLVGNSIASQVLNTSDRVMINSLVGTAEVGIYSTLYSVSSIALMVWTAINNSFVPFLFENVESEDGSKQVNRVSTILITAVGVVALTVSLISPEIVAILATEEYYSASAILPPIIAGVYLISLSNLYTNMLIYIKKTKYIMLSSSIAALSNISLNFIGIPIFGYEFAAYSTLISYTILVIIQGIMSESVYSRMHARCRVYDDCKLATISVLVIACCIACIPLYSFKFIRYVIAATIVLIAFSIRKKFINIFKY